MTVAAASQATLTLVTNRADIGACDSIDWGQFGGPGTSVPSPSKGWTTEGTKFAVGDETSNMSTDVSSGVPNGGGGNWWGFGAGHNVLYTDSLNGPLNIVFARTMTAAGADIMVNFFGTYTAELLAYDAMGDPLGSVTTTIVSDANTVGNAPFLGVHSDGGDIAVLQYRLKTSDQTGGFAIDEVSLNDCCSPVPEPASMATLGIGLAGIVARRRSKKARA